MIDESGEGLFGEQDLQPQTLAELDMDRKDIETNRIKEATDELAAAAATGDFLDDMITGDEDEARSDVEGEVVVNAAKDLLNSRFTRRRYLEGGRTQDLRSIGREPDPANGGRDWPLTIYYTQEPENDANVTVPTEDTSEKKQPPPIINPLVLEGVDVTRAMYGDRGATKITDYFFAAPEHGGEITRRTTLILDYGGQDPASNDAVISSGSISTIRKAKSHEVLAIPEKLRAAADAEQRRQDAWKAPKSSSPQHGE